MLSATKLSILLSNLWELRVTRSRAIRVGSASDPRRIRFEFVRSSSIPPKQCRIRVIRAGSASDIRWMLGNGYHLISVDIHYSMDIYGYPSNTNAVTLGSFLIAANSLLKLGCHILGIQKIQRYSWMLRESL